MTSDSQFLDAYRSFLERNKRPTEKIQEATDWRGAAFRYFYRDVGGTSQKADEAVVSSTGKIFSANATEGLAEFLSQAALSADDKAIRYCWLHGSMAPVGPGVPFKDPRIAPLLTKASTSKDAHGSLTLRFWAMSPPETEAPYLVEVAASSAGAPHTTARSWQEVAGLASPHSAETPKKDVLNPDF